MAWCVNATANPSKFQCPTGTDHEDWIHCCGVDQFQYCCVGESTWTVKWGITIAIVGGLLLLMLVGYAVQLLRISELCCPDWLTSCMKEDSSDFAWETKWYTVSHEGNRYGVTFHSKRFAKHFMRALEERYGPWNTANILKIKREEEEYVVLNIFFHEHFTPWFYTQGPIKHDEEWIKTDFREICAHVTDHLAHRSCCNSCIQHEESDHGACRVSITKPLSPTIYRTTYTPATNKSEFEEKSNLTDLICTSGGHQYNSLLSASSEDNILCPSDIKVKASPNRRALRPWTKASFRDFYMRAANPSAGGTVSARSEKDVPKSSLYPLQQVYKGGGISESSYSKAISTSLYPSGPGIPPPVVIHVIDAIVDSCGNEKGTQTARQIRIS